MQLLQVYPLVVRGQGGLFYRLPQHEVGGKDAVGEHVFHPFTQCGPFLLVLLDTAECGRGRLVLQVQ